MDNRILTLLESSNPDDRKRGIKALVKTDTSEEALRKLVALYKTDPDPDVQQLALAAGRRIRQKQKEQEWEGSGMERGPVEKEPVAPTVAVSEANVSKAKSLMDRAMNSLVESDYDKAQDLVVRAYEANPNLVNDSYYMGLMTSVLQVSSDQVVPMLDAYISGDGSLPDVEGKPKRKRGPQVDDVSAGRAILDLAIYGAVNALLIFLLFSGGTFLLSSLVSSVPITADSTDAFNASGVSPEVALQQSIALLQSAGLLFGVVYGVIFGISAIISHVIFFTVVHFVSTTMLNGAGTWAGLIHKVTFPVLAYTVLSWVLTALFYGFVIANSADALLAGASDAEIAAQLNPLNGLFIVFSLGSLIYFFVYIFHISSLIGKAEGFGMGSGCASIIISMIMMAVLSCACSFLFTTITASVFESALTASSF